MQSSKSEQISSISSTGSFFSSSMISLNECWEDDDYFTGSGMLNESLTASSVVNSISASEYGFE